MLRRDSTREFTPEQNLQRETRIIWGTVVAVLVAFVLLGLAGKVFGQEREGRLAFTRFSPFVRPIGLESQADSLSVTCSVGLSYRYNNWSGVTLEHTLVHGQKPRTSLTTKIVLW